MTYDPTKFRQNPSNPIPSFDPRSQQASEQPIFLNQPACAGMCQATVPTYDMWFKWGDVNPWSRITTGLPTTDIPNPSDWWFIFDNQRLSRTPISQVDWTPPNFPNTTPLLQNVNVNWASPLMGSSRQTPKDVINNTSTPNTYPNVQWFLCYCNSINSLSGTIPDNESQLDTSLIQSVPLTTTDSQVETTTDSIVDANGTDMPTGPDCSGWILALLKKQVVATDASGNTIDTLLQGAGGDTYTDPTPTWHPYLMCSLHPQNYMYNLTFGPQKIELPPPVTGDNVAGPIFNCLQRNLWYPTYNPINWPPFLIQLVPVAP